MTAQNNAPTGVGASAGAGGDFSLHGSVPSAGKQYRGAILTLRLCDACSQLPVVRALSIRLAARILRRLVQQQRRRLRRGVMP